MHRPLMVPPPLIWFALAAGLLTVAVDCGGSPGSISVNITSPGGQVVTTDATIQGTARGVLDDLEVEIDDRAPRPVFSIENDGTWAIDIPDDIPDGLHTAVARATRNGDEATDRVEFFVSDEPYQVRVNPETTRFFEAESGPVARATLEFFIAPEWKGTIWLSVDTNPLLVFARTPSDEDEVFSGRGESRGPDIELSWDNRVFGFDMRADPSLPDARYPITIIADGDHATVPSEATFFAFRGLAPAAETLAFRVNEGSTQRVGADGERRPYRDDWDLSTTCADFRCGSSITRHQPDFPPLQLTYQGRDSSARDTYAVSSIRLTEHPECPGGVHRNEWSGRITVIGRSPTGIREPSVLEFDLAETNTCNDESVRFREGTASTRSPSS